VGCQGKGGGSVFQQTPWLGLYSLSAQQRLTRCIAFSSYRHVLSALWQTVWVLLPAGFYSSLSHGQKCGGLDHLKQSGTESYWSLKLQCLLPGTWQWIRSRKTQNFNEVSLEHLRQITHSVEASLSFNITLQHVLHLPELAQSTMVGKCKWLFVSGCNWKTPISKVTAF
jgi:hypothetical protein